jgi:hypothetical protein
MKHDLHDTLIRNSVARIEGGHAVCTGCERTPLTGELMHDTGDGRHLCSLCVTTVPEGQRESLRTERVHAGTLRLAVAPVAAAA